MSPTQSSGISRITPSAAARAELIARGQLRVAFPVASALYVVKDPATAGLRGVSIEVGTELARRLDVPFEPRPYATVAISFTPSMPTSGILPRSSPSTIGGPCSISARRIWKRTSTHLVPQDSRILSVPDADVSGIRIGVAERSAFDLFLTRTLKHASLVRYPGVKAAFEGFRSKENDAVAAPRPVLVTELSKIPPARILDDRFDVARVAIAMRKGRGRAAIPFVNEFIAEVR